MSGLHENKQSESSRRDRYELAVNQPLASVESWRRGQCLGRGLHLSNCWWVIAIIGILAAILLPALAARAGGGAEGKLSKQSQTMGLGIQNVFGGKQRQVP